MARAASGAGVVTAPNISFAGPFSVVLTSFGSAEGRIAAVFAGLLMGSAATDPQARTSNHETAIL